MYVALLTSAPDDGTTMASMAEIAAPGVSGYARQPFDPDDPLGTETTGNTSQLSFGPFSANLSPVTHIALVSEPTGTVGDLVWYWTVDVVKDPAIGDSVVIQPGSLTMSSD
jgi:hypothetical protein